MKIKAVVTDMDGVLFDTERLFTESFRTACKTLGYSAPEGTEMRVLGTNSAHCRQVYLESFAPGFDYDRFMQEVRRLTSDRIEQEGIPVKPGVRELFDFLRRNGYLLAVATSTRREKALDNFRRAGLTDCFDAIVCGDMVANSKPSPEIYMTAAKMLGVDPNECLAIEDSPNGLLSAFRAGMLPVMVPDLIAPTEELMRIVYRQVDSLHDVIRLLNELHAMPEY